eukprot:4690780-Pyramimonas_sp.AAC.1
MRLARPGGVDADIGVSPHRRRIEAELIDCHTARAATEGDRRRRCQGHPASSREYRILKLCRHHVQTTAPHIRRIIL